MFVLKKLLLLLFLLIFIFFSKDVFLISPVSEVYGQQNPVYDFEIKTIKTQENLTFNLTVGQNEVNNLPNNTPIEFTLLERNQAETQNSQMFGFAGVQGQWDLQNVHLDYHKKYFHQETDSTITTEKMLEKHFAMHAALGVKWIGMEYTWIQANQNQPINFYYLDKIFSVAKKYNLKILPILDETPRWATSLACNEDRNDGYPTCAMATKCVPKDLNDNGSKNFNNFVRQVVERYKPHGTYDPNSDYGITHWVIWNEPNHAFGNFWTDCRQATAIVKNSNGQNVNQYDTGYRPVGSIEDYAKLFKGGYSTIKQVAPGAIVLMAGIAGIGPDDRHHKIKSYEKFYTELNRISSPKPDIWNAHIYMERINHFLWDLSFIKDKRNQLDPNKEIWVTEFGFYRDFTPQKWVGQLNNISEIFSLKDQFISWNVKKLLYWTAKGYVMCDPNQAGCIPYTDIAACGYKNYEGCQGKPYGEFEMGTLLMSPNFYPDPVYLKFGEKMGTVTQVGDNIQTIVGNNRINVNIPASRFQNGKEYLLIISSPTKIVTTKPWIVRVGNNPNPICPICPTGLPAKNQGNANCDGVIDRGDLGHWVNQFTGGEVPSVSADFNCNGKVDREDLAIWINGFTNPAILH